MTNNDEKVPATPTPPKKNQTPNRGTRLSSDAPETARIASRRKRRSEANKRRHRGSKSPSHSPDQRFPKVSPEQQKSINKPSKSRCDPSARYYSGSNALPDYGTTISKRLSQSDPIVDSSPLAASHEMGLKRLKSINAVSAPVNTITSSQNHSSSKAAKKDSPTRRQRPGPTPTQPPYTTRFFSTTPGSSRKPRTGNSAEDDRHDKHDEDDIYDIKSTTSSNDRKSSNANREVRPATLPEYRNAQPRHSQGSGNRQRKSRLSISQQLSDADSSMISSKTPRRNTHSSTSDSPDILALAEHPPARDVPDLSPHSSRRKRVKSPVREAASAQPNKRVKIQQAKEPFDLSGDELSMDSRGRQGRETERRTTRGDIQHANFRPLASQCLAEATSKSEVPTKSFAEYLAGATPHKSNDRSSRRQSAENASEDRPRSASKTSSKDTRGAPKTETYLNKLKTYSRKRGQPIELLDPVEEIKAPALPRHPSTRWAKRTSSERPVPDPEIWTRTHPDWEKAWHNSLVFPPTGKNRTTVDAADICRLDEEQYLNDNLINFYLRYLQTKLERDQPEVLKKVHIFSTFFYEKLRSIKGKINYEGVKAWTAKINLFAYDYVVVPVNENNHWYLAIICNLPTAFGLSIANEAEPTDLVESRKRNGSNRLAGGHSIHLDPKIITLDSLGSAHPSTCRVLREYLVEEARNKIGFDLTALPAGLTVKGAPEQDNYCDCGVFVLGYMEEFLSDPNRTAHTLLRKDGLSWDIRPSELRNRIRKLLFDLQSEQQDRLDEEKKQKRRAREMKAADNIKSPSSNLQTLQISTTLNVLPSVATGAAGDESPSGFHNETDGSGLKGGAARDTNSSSEPYYSAASSPTSRNIEGSSRLAVESAARPRSFSEDQLASDGGPQFVQRLATSSEEEESSEEVVPVRKTAPLARVKGYGSLRSSSSKKAAHTSPADCGTTSIYFQPRKSIESDEPAKVRIGPQYDGIDRTAKPRRRRTQAGESV